MAEVAMSGYAHHHRHTSSIGSLAPGGILTQEPTFEMVPNPTFSFPMKPQASGSSTVQVSTSSPRRRPMSMQLGLPGAEPGLSNPHRRTTSALPSFSFNAGDASGLHETGTPPDTPSETTPATPRRGHRRGGSEFVGGDSRFGVSNAISTSPTKTSAMSIPLPSDNALPLPISTGRRGHAHRRSAALSSHDVRNIMQPNTEPMPRLSSSLPSTPLEHPAHTPSAPLDRCVSAPMHAQDIADVSGRDTSPSRPVSRPRVGFSDNIEIIPRPLSTISSETESSMSTMRGHSLNNSISSMISMGSGSPSGRHPRRSVDMTSMTAISEQAPRSRSSIEISKRIEKEGEWLKSKNSSSTIDRGPSDAGASSPALTFASSELPTTPRTGHCRKHSLGHSLGFDRRKSEPSFPARLDGPSRLSAISLQEHVVPEKGTPASGDVSRRSSTRRIKDWAAAKLHRRSRDLSKVYAEPVPRAESPQAEPVARPQSESSAIVPGRVQRTDVRFAEPSTAETDLDAVFNAKSNTADSDDSNDESRVVFNIPTFASTGSSYDFDNDEEYSMVDLDAALGPGRTPPIGSGSQRKPLHSARNGGGPSAYLHRRAESAPTLTPFDFGRSIAPSQPSMADVFEEDEEDDGLESRISPTNLGFTEPGVGISVVDADQSTSGFGFEDGLRIQRGCWEPERPSTSYGNMGATSRLSTPVNDRRASSIIEQTIIEESSPVEAPEAVQIVEDFEEPRSSSLTKSSDSSETPTLLALPDSTSVMTPETFQTSTFSSPDFARRQGSFDTSRLGTAASSIADNRTVSSCTTGEPHPDVRVSVDDVPSLTSSRSTMLSTAHANTSHRDFGTEQRTPSGSSSTLDPAVAAERRRKRASIQSLSQLMGGSFGPKAKASEEFRPQTATAGVSPKPKKEHRLKKLMFWKSKQSARQSSTSSNKLQKEQLTT